MFVLLLHICLLHPVKTFAVGLLAIDIHSFIFVCARNFAFHVCVRGVLRESDSGTGATARCRKGRPKGKIKT